MQRCSGMASEAASGNMVGSSLKPWGVGEGRGGEGGVEGRRGCWLLWEWRSGCAAQQPAGSAQAPHAADNQATGRRQDAGTGRRGPHLLALLPGLVPALAVAHAPALLARQAAQAGQLV